MIIELIIDTDTIRNLQEHNYKLKLENAQLHREARARHEVIEIVDRRTPDTDFTFPNTEGI